MGAQNPLEMMMKSLCVRILLFCSLVVGAGICQAQSLNHYPAGVEGIKGSSLPPPGFYLRDYNYIYFSDYLKGGGPPSFDIFVNVQAPRLIWITPKKLMGGYYGMDVLVPFAYQDLDMTGFRGSDFGLGDIFVEPITLSWHAKQYDVSFGYGFWAPTGDYTATNPVSPGKGFLTHMLTGGITVYTDAEKTWSLSALSRYEISQENDQTKITPGHYYTIEWGLAKSITKTIEAGLVGYVQTQTTKASGLSALGSKDGVVGVGPELNLAIPKLGVSTSFRYLRETGARNRTEGNAFNITITRRLGGPSK
jgi:hypothetical protein